MRNLSVLVFSFFLMASAYGRKITLTPAKLAKFGESHKFSSLLVFTSKRAKFYDEKGRKIFHLKMSSRGQIIHSDNTFLYVSFDRSCTEKACALIFKKHNKKFILHKLPETTKSIKIQNSILYKNAYHWRSCRYCDDQRFYAVSPYFKKMGRTQIVLRASSRNI